MTTVSKESYLGLLADRPYKFSKQEVDYREGEGEEVCRTCVHFFERVTDKFHTCEIYRASDDSSVDASYVCDCHTVDGETFPLLDEQNPD